MAALDPHHRAARRPLLQGRQLIDERALKGLEARIGYAFRKRALLAEAMTHASAFEGREGGADNERLEFLGDRVLGLVVAEQLFTLFPATREAGLAPRLNAVVNRQACARAARRCGLGESLVLSPAEERGGGRDKETILADACEALIAAIYLDGGLEAARAFVLSAFADEFAHVEVAPRDPKMALQEWAAGRRREPPRYTVVARTGPDHAPEFVVEAALKGMAPATGKAGSKREAERAAAEAMLRSLGIE